jgi:uncharacterized protein (TIGR02646 family)
MRFIDKTGKEPNYLLTHRLQNRVNNYKTFSHAGLGNIEESGKHSGLRKDLVYLQGYLCCFCMCRIPQSPHTNNDVKIAHWYPQNGELTQKDQKDIVFSNLFAACRGGDVRPEVKSDRKGYTCDKKQDDNFLVVNPSNRKHIDLIKYESEGEIFCIKLEGKDEAERKANLKDMYEDLRHKKGVTDKPKKRLKEGDLTDDELKIAIQYDIEFNLNLNEITLKTMRSSIFKKYSEKLRNELKPKAGKFMDRSKKNEYLQSEIKKHLSPISVNKFTPFCMVYVFCAKEKVR